MSDEALGVDLDGAVLDVHELALSPKEQAMWLFHNFAELGVLNIPAAYRTSRPLRPDLLQRAVDQVVARHPALRSTFPAADGTPVRRVLAAQDPAAKCQVLRVQVDAASLPAELTRLTQPPFDIETQIPVRVGHLVGDPAGEVLCLVIQHIACDAESFGVLVRELGQFYLAAERGDPVPDHLTGEVPRYAEQSSSPQDVEYWRAQLAGADASARLLDIGRAGAERVSYTAGQYAVRLSGAAVDGVNALCAELAMTPNIALLTIFSVLLSMSGAGQDMVVGVPADVRDRDGKEAVGYHVNLLAVRARMPPDSSLRAVAHAVREAYLGGLMHAKVSLDELLPGSYEATGTYRNPLFRHMFNYRPARGVISDEFVAAGVEANIGYTRLDLQVTAFAVDGQIQMAALYSDELFGREDIVALLDRMDLLIRVCAEMPDMSLADLAMLAAPADGEAAQEPAAATAVSAPAVAGGVSAAEQELFELLVGLWREILRSPELDADAHFFRSGGTSLRAAQLVARVKSQTGVKLSLRNVFRAPTPRQLARAMAAAGQAG